MKIALKGKVIPSYLQYHNWKNTKTISIDLKAKWAVIDADGNDGDVPTIFLGFDKGTLHLNNKYKSDITELSFPKFKGYTILCSQISKYTLTITFVKY